MEFIHIFIESLGFAIYTFAIALLFAIAEIQIEGRSGWSGGGNSYTITAHTKSPYLIIKVLSIIAKILHKPVTGYHLVMFLIPPLFFHFPFFYGVEWSCGKELDILSLYFMWFLVWDFLWFVLNPFFKAESFRKEKLSWYTGRWFGRLPFDYIVSIIISFGFVYFRSRSNDLALKQYGAVVLMWLILLIITMSLAFVYHWWYFWIREAIKQSEE